MEKHTLTREKRKHCVSIFDTSFKRPAKLPIDRFASAGFVLGLLAAACIVVLVLHPKDSMRYALGLVSLLGLCAGCGGLYGTLRKRNRKRGLAFSISGVLLCLAGLQQSDLLAMARESDGHPVRCRSNLKMLGIVFRMFANESPDGLYPPLSSEPGRLMFDNDAAGYSHVYPDYLTDPTIMFCSQAKGYRAFIQACLQKEPDIHYLLDDHCFFYLGYAVTCDEDVEAFALAYKERIGKGQAFEDDILLGSGEGSEDGRTIPRLHATALEEVTDSAETSRESRSPVAVLIERLGNHEEPGANVLYLDGRVEFIPYPGPWPMTPKTMSILNELDSLGATEGGP